MEIQFNFKNFEPSEHLKKYAENRFRKLEKYIKRIDSAYLQVNMEVDKYRQKIDVVFNADDIHISAQEESQDMYASIDKVLDKMDAQLRKMKDKEKDRRKGKLNKSQTFKSESIRESVSEGYPNIVMSDNYIPKPISIEDAAIELQRSDNNFVVFINSDTKRVNVLYKKKNGDFGLIDPQI
ncbi:ribosome-associated translation inhibitor RaiA [Desulfothermus naphthae]